MSGFKKAFIIFVFGSVVGFVVCYLIFCRNHKIENTETKILIEKNSEEITSPPTTTLKQNSQQIKLTTKLETPHYGTISLNHSIDRKSMQYRHQFGVGGGILLTTRTPYIKVDYSYNNLGFELLGGYSFEVEDFEIGVGARYVWKF